MPTILELFQNDQVLSNQVKPDKRTLVDVETSGIRVDTKVDVNNPAIYGFDSIRITRRTTDMLDTMKNDRGTQGLGGLIGGTIGKAKQKANNLSAKLLGFPAPLNPANVIAIGKSAGAWTPLTGFIPTFPRVFEDNSSVQNILGKFSSVFSGIPYGPGNEQDTSFNISKIKHGYGGSEIGKLIKKSLMGPPSSFLPQVQGGGIKLVKDKLRNALFGNGSLRDNTPKKHSEFDAYGSGPKKYSWITRDLGNDINQDGPITAEEFKEVNPLLEKVSPIYGVQRKPKFPWQIGGKFGNNKTNYGYNAYTNDKVSKYSPVDGENYSEIRKEDKNYKDLFDDNKYHTKKSGKTLDERGVGGKGNHEIGLISPQSDAKIDEKGVITADGVNKEYFKDLVPFHITRIGQKKNIFKSYITGLSETVTPSWSSNNFIGNPYKYYIYESIERSVTFTLNIAAESPEELARNWEKLSHLTKAAYPLIPYQEGDEKISANIVSPPFIRFTLGDMYRERFGVLDSLSYTVPDNTPWETDIDGFVLPKFMEASITIKFAEDVASGNVDKLYDFKKDGTNFLTNPIN